MFNSICIRPHSKLATDRPIDIGLLAECMLFYDKVNVIANRQMLKQLIIDCGFDTLIELLELGLLDISYTENFTGIHSTSTKLGQVHRPIIFRSPQHKFQDVLPKLLIEITGKEGKGRRSARRIKPLLKVIDYPNTLTEETQKDFENPAYMSKAIPTLLTLLVPEFKPDNSVKFKIITTDKGLIVESNINLEKLNEFYHRRVPPSHSSITYAHILSHIMNANSDLYFSANYLSEISTDIINSSLLNQRLSYIISKREKSEGNIGEFQYLIFNNAKAIRESISSGQCYLSEYIEVLKKSMKFKGWLREKDPEEKLIKSYYEDVTKESFIDKLPSKSVRWGIFTGTGLVLDAVATGGIATAVGVGLGTIDTFILDRLLKGWKPNQFIEDELEPVINKNT
jgi:hypothetical protein